MSYTFRPAKRENVPLLLGVAGGTGSGKTYSALLLARGIADGAPIAGIDTENGRMNHYADEFPELHVAGIEAPFRPQKYAGAVAGAVEFLAAQKVAPQNRAVIVDSVSHEWAGDGGCLDWHDEIMGDDQSKNLQAWILPKRAHKEMLTQLLQVQAHVILCFRAEPKVEAIRRNGKLEIVPKHSVTGLDGWLPISEKMMPYELTASFLLMAERPGIPRPIKLQEQHRSFVALDKPLEAETGRLLREWAAGGDKPSTRESRTELLRDARVDKLLRLCDELGATDSIPAVHEHAEKGDWGWIERAITAGEAALAGKTSGAGSTDPARENAEGETGQHTDEPAPEESQESFFEQRFHEAEERRESRRSRSRA